MQPAILVTGAPRSGTTFVGKMLCVPRHMAYLDEPFNYETGLIGVKKPLVYLGEETPEDNRYYKQLIKDLLNGHGHFHSSSLPGLDEHPLKRAGRQIFHSRSELGYHFDILNPFRTRFLIKDPMACLAAGQLHRTLGLKTIVIIRHPASTVASYMRLRWNYKLQDLTNQPELMRQHLEPILEGLDLAGLTQIQTWAYFWLCLYTVMDAYLNENNGIKKVIFQDLSVHPQEEFKKLYDYCDLPWSRAASFQIDRHTNFTNPVDPKVGEAHALKRYSAANVRRWHKLLEPDEIAEIRRITEPLSQKYFPDTDW